MMDKTILQYQISDWSQLNKCHSNNSPCLSISVSKFMQNSDISGTKIEVKHKKYGILFAYTITPQGNLVSDMCKCKDVVNTSILLNELRRYGFYIDYVEEYHLSLRQVEFLKTLQGLNFDKIRLCAVHEVADVDDVKLYITAFNIKNHDQWLNSGYSPSRKEWESAILDGSAMNVSGLEYAQDFNWSWIYNAVFDLDQIIQRYEDDE